MLQRQKHNIQQEKISLEVTSITLQLVLLIYNFQFRSIFLHVIEIVFTVSISVKKEHFSSNDLDLRTGPRWD